MRWLVVSGVAELSIYGQKKNSRQKVPGFALHAPKFTQAQRACPAALRGVLNGEASAAAQSAPSALPLAVGARVRVRREAGTRARDNCDARSRQTELMRALAHKESFADAAGPSQAHERPLCQRRKGQVSEELRVSASRIDLPPLSPGYQCSTSPTTALAGARFLHLPVLPGPHRPRLRPRDRHCRSRRRPLPSPAHVVHPPALQALELRPHGCRFRARPRPSEHGIQRAVWP